MRFSSRERRPRLLSALVVLSVVLVLVCGAAHASTGGTIVAWGCIAPPGAGGDFGQCAVPAGAATFAAIAAGDAHSLAVTEEGAVLAWGCGGGVDFGQCAVPAGVTHPRAIAAGTYDSLAVSSEGAVVAWGCGGGLDFGQCSVPAAASSSVIAVAAGQYHSLALKQDGAVLAWGCSGADFGQCDVPPAASSGVTAVAAAESQSLALKQDGSVVAWGCGPGSVNVGQCDVPPAATNGVVAVAAGAYHSLALKQDGSVVAWGCGGGLDFGQCSVPPPAASGVTAIAAGWFHSLALKADGSVVSWGCQPNPFITFTDFGQCAVPASAASGVTAISAGTFHSLALVGPTNRPPDCSDVTASPASIWPGMRDTLVLVTLSGAIDPDGDSLSYRVDGVTQDEPVRGGGDDTSPDAALTASGADSNQLLVRSEANSHYNGRVYRIAYTVSDGKGGACSGTAGPRGNTTAKVGVQRNKGTPAIDDGNAMSWNSFTGAPVP